jgi:RNA polymerase sigma-70 factor (ECF subfamily)
MGLRSSFADARMMVMSPARSHTSPGVSRETIADWYREHAPFVWKSLDRLGVARADLNDCAQKVFETALRRAPSFQDGKPAKPWLFGIAFRVYVQHRRASARDPLELSEDEVAISPEWTPDQAVERKQGWELVQLFLERLPPEQRAVFVMHELDGVPMPGVARELGVLLNTAYSRLRLARAAFERFAAFRRSEKEAR